MCVRVCLCCVQAKIALMHGGVTAVEVELCHTSVTWPYLSDMSLVSAVVSIFVPNWGIRQVRVGGRSCTMHACVRAVSMHHVLDGSVRPAAAGP